MTYVTGACRWGRRLPGGGRVRAVWTCLALGALFSPTLALHAAEVEFADGRRVAVTEPRKDSKGTWTALREGRRTVLRPGEVIVVTEDSGTETVTIPALSPAPDPPDVTAALAVVTAPGSRDWEPALDALARRPSQAVLDALLALGGSSDKELRTRAIRALVALRTRESTLSAAKLVLAEKGAADRRRAASHLFAVQGIFRRSEGAALSKRGLADADAGVRIQFALLAPTEDGAANDVLRSEGLRHTDHHFREASAMELGARGDAAGETILCAMLARTSMTGAERGDATSERLLVEERVRVCGLLGGLRTPKAKAALEAAKGARDEAVRAAATAALARFDAAR